MLMLFAPQNVTSRASEGWGVKNNFLGLLSLAIRPPHKLCYYSTTADVTCCYSVVYAMRVAVSVSRSKRVSPSSFFLYYWQTSTNFSELCRGSCVAVSDSVVVY